MLCALMETGHSSSHRSNSTKLSHFRTDTSTDFVDGFVKRLQEPGTVSLTKRRGAARYLTQLPQLAQEIAGCKGKADVVA